MSKVQVLSEDGQPLNRCHPARARELLKKRRAVVASAHPYTIRLVRAVDQASQKSSPPRAQHDFK